MARIEFGHTWWGRRWLDALSNIDYQSRLPRGVRYARNGSVKSIETQHTLVEARVQGTRPSPYKVALELWSFSAEQERAIASLVKESPYFLTQLEARRLPPELDEACGAAGIRLFPNSWEELNMHCSCPDWAVPCKHLAAVVYLIANEIDKNPFLVFAMHGFDLLAAIRGERDEEEQTIVGIDSLVAAKEEEYNYFAEHLTSREATRTRAESGGRCLRPVLPRHGWQCREDCHRSRASIKLFIVRSVVECHTSERVRPGLVDLPLRFIGAI